MRIVHISTFSNGGAAIAVKRLHEALISSGLDSIFLTLGKSGPSPSQFEYYGSLTQWQKVYFKILDNISTRKALEQKYLPKISALHLKSEIYTCPFTRFHLELHPLIKNADIVHLHWVSWFLDFPSFFKNIDKPIVWTFHDMNPFMGGFHYSRDLENYYNEAKGMEDLFYKVKSDAIESFKGLINIVTPSKWLAEEASKSKLFSNRSISVIPNSINEDQFLIQSRELARKSLGIPDSKKVLLFIADSVENPRKGFEFLAEAIKKIHSTELMLLTVGRSQVQLASGIEVKQLGIIQDKQLLSSAFTAANALVIPSLEDNLPNVMLEAFMCGTPVVAFPVGGLKEHVVNGFTGQLANGRTGSGLAEAINKLLNEEGNYSAVAIREYAKTNFAPEKIADQYLGIYRKMLAAKQD